MRGFGVAMLAVMAMIMFSQAAAAAADQTRDPNAPVTVEAWGSYLMGDKDSKQDARQLALFDAKRQALEKAGTELSTQTTVQNFELVKDEILSRAAGRIQADILEEKWEYVGESMKVRIHIRATVRPADFTDATSAQTVVATPTPVPTPIPTPVAVQTQPSPNLPREIPQTGGYPYGNSPGNPSQTVGIAPAHRDNPGESLAVGYRLVREGRLREALAYSDNILKSYPRFAETYLLRAKIYQEAKRPGLAVDALKKGCELGSERACQLLGSAFERTPQQQPAPGERRWQNNRSREFERRQPY